MTAAGSRSARVGDALALQAAACGHMGSPLYRTLLDRAARDYDDGGPVRALFDADPAHGSESTIGVRLMGALHACALDGTAPALAAHFPSCGGDGDATGAWQAMREFVASSPDAIVARLATTPQTNEVARSMPLLAGALAVASVTGYPLRVFDGGASAGLNARFDRYRYEGQGWAWGSPASALTLRNRTLSGKPRFLDAALMVVQRAACDLHPLDIGNENDVLTLRAFVWADQLERFERLNRALEVAAQVPLTVEKDDVLSWTRRNFTPRAGTATVTMHSVFGEHLPKAMLEELHAVIEGAGAAATFAAPLAWVRLELESGIGYRTSVKIWPGGQEIVLARSDGHGQNIEWGDGSA